MSQGTPEPTRTGLPQGAQGSGAATNPGNYSSIAAMRPDTDSAAADGVVLVANDVPTDDSVTVVAYEARTDRSTQRTSNSMASTISSRRLQRSASRRLASPRTQARDAPSDMLPHPSSNLSVLVEARPADLPDEVRRVLTSMDETLITVLLRGDIRLVRAAWLCEQPDGFRIKRRQDLELLDAETSPLLSPEEAVALVRRGTRAVGTLSYGMLAAYSHTRPRAAWA